MLLSSKEGALIDPIREVRAKGMSHMIPPQSQTHMTSVLSLVSDVPLSLGGLCDTDSTWAFIGPSLCFGAPWSVSNSTWSVSACSPSAVPPPSVGGLQPLLQLQRHHGPLLHCHWPAQVGARHGPPCAQRRLLCH